MTGKNDSTRQCITLRARHLIRPSCVAMPPLLAEPLADNYAGAWAKSQLANRGALFGQHHQPDSELVLGGPSDLLSLPQHSGALFLGEVFPCHINLHNHSPYECRNVILKVSVQGTSGHTPLALRTSVSGQLPPGLAEGGGVSGVSGGSTPGGIRLRPQENFVAVVHHELRELGENTLLCLVSYIARMPASHAAQAGLQGTTVGGNEVALVGGENEPEVDVKMDFIKNFRLLVEKPFDFKQTQIPTPGPDIYVEAEIENRTPRALMIERIEWQPGPLLKVTDLNTIVDWTRRKHEGRPTSGFMAPHDVWRLLYRLQPLGNQPAGEEVKLGQVDIAWRSGMGEVGHICTFPYVAKPPEYHDVSIEVLDLPTRATVEEPLQMVCKITNRSNRVMELLLTRPDSGSGSHDDGGGDSTAAASDAAFPAFVWTGVTHQRLSTLQPGESIQQSLEFVPVMTGLQEMPPIQLREISTEKHFTFKDLGRVFVSCASEAA